MSIAAFTPALPAVTDDRGMTGLPAENQPWPPIRWNPIAFDYRVWDAWWSGDPDKLMRAYSPLGANSPISRQYFATTGEAGITQVKAGQYRGGLIGSIRRFFWGQLTPPGEKRTNYHIPLAADLASTSADLLFSQPPALKYEDDTATQDYLDDLIDDGMHAKLLEAAETAAALGGVYLRVVWDSDVADEPWLDLVPVDSAVPEFRYDRLTAVTFWHVVEDHGKTVVRHLEKHIPHDNVILHGVFVGDQQKLGRQVDLGAFQETAPLVSVMTDGDAIRFPDQPPDASTVVYVPNIKPNRIWRDLGPMAAPLGRSDFAGLETELDGLDEAFSSWMRDIRLGKARLIVPHSYLDNIGRGKGAVFEPEREVFSPINMLVSGETTGGTGILPQQFDIRWQAHQATVNAVIENIITSAGYSGQSLGLQGDIAQTATEVIARERKSLKTRGKKINYWRPAYADIIYGLMSISREFFGGDLEPVRPDIEFPDVVQPDMAQLAQTIATLRGAESMSIETAVAEAHPDWDTEKVAAETARIYAEMNVDAMSRARVMISGPPGESLAQQLEEIPGALGMTDVAGQVEAVAAATRGSDSGNIGE
jgi:hypothetical protein